MRGVTQPPVYHPEGDVLTHVCLVLDHVPEGDLGLAWSAVLHDVGKPPTWRLAADRIRFDGHDALSARMADGILQRLRARHGAARPGRRDLREAHPLRRVAADAAAAP
jgi:poly(A) polymerase